MARAGQDIICSDVQRYLVLLAGSGGKPVRSRINIHAMLLMAADDHPGIADRLDYNPRYYGPYSDRVDHELEHLENVGIISTGSGGISLTDEGRAAETGIRRAVDKDILEELDGYKEYLNDITRDEMLAFMYTQFPVMMEESVEYERIRHRKEPLMMSLLKKEKVSSGRAAELLGVTQSRIFRNMNRMGMRVFR